MKKNTNIFIMIGLITLVCGQPQSSQAMWSVLTPKEKLLREEKEQAERQKIINQILENIKKATQNINDEKQSIQNILVQVSRKIKNIDKMIEENIDKIPKNDLTLVLKNYGSLYQQFITAITVYLNKVFQPDNIKTTLDFLKDLTEEDSYLILTYFILIDPFPKKISDDEKNTTNEFLQKHLNTFIETTNRSINSLRSVDNLRSDDSFQKLVHDILLSSKVLETIKDHFFIQKKSKLLENEKKELSELKKNLYNLYDVDYKGKKISIKTDYFAKRSELMDDKLVGILPKIVTKDSQPQPSLREKMMRVTSRTIALGGATTIALKALTDIDKPIVAIEKVGLALAVALSALVEVQAMLEPKKPLSKTRQAIKRAVLLGGVAGLTTKAARYIDPRVAGTKEVLVATAIGTVLGAVISTISSLASEMIQSHK